MKVIKYHICPVCERRFASREAAELCRQKHQIRIEEICYCSTCGAGWYVNSYGPELAAKLAKECERKHRDNGDEESTAMRTYFLSGGAFGKPKCLKG